MKAGKVLAVLLTGVVLLASGCVTAETLAAAKTEVTYKPKVEDGVVIGSEVDKVKKGKPAYYALVPLAVATDAALLPVYVPVTIAVNLGILPVP